MKSLEFAAGSFARIIKLVERTALSFVFCLIDGGHKSRAARTQDQDFCLHLKKILNVFLDFQ